LGTKGETGGATLVGPPGPPQKKGDRGGGGRKTNCGRQKGGEILLRQQRPVRKKGAAHYLHLPRKEGTREQKRTLKSRTELRHRELTVKRKKNSLKWAAKNEGGKRSSTKGGPKKLVRD